MLRWGWNGRVHFITLKQLEISFLFLKYFWKLHRILINKQKLQCYHLSLNYKSKWTTGGYMDPFNSPGYEICLLSVTAFLLFYLQNVSYTYLINMAVTRSLCFFSYFLFLFLVWLHKLSTACTCKRQINLMVERLSVTPY